MWQNTAGIPLLSVSSGTREHWQLDWECDERLTCKSVSNYEPNISSWLKNKPPTPTPAWAGDEGGRSPPHPEEERELPAVEAHPEELRLDPLLLDDVVVVRRLHFLSESENGAERRLHAAYARVRLCAGDSGGVLAATRCPEQKQ